MERSPRLTRRDQEWLEHLRACGAGSLKAYAVAHGLDVDALYAAKSRLKAKGALVPRRARLVRVTPVATLPSVDATMARVHLRNGVVVDVAVGGAGFDALLSSAAALP